MLEAVGKEKREVVITKYVHKALNTYLAFTGLTIGGMFEVNDWRRFEGLKIRRWISDVDEGG